MKDEKTVLEIQKQRRGEAGNTLSLRLKPWRSEELFGATNEIAILHDGEEYRLRITRNNKLILTK